MTTTEIKSKTLDANARLDLCLCFLNQADLALFVKYLKEATEALADCRSALCSSSCELEFEMRGVLATVVRHAGTRASQYLNLGYQIFGMERLNAAIEK